MGMKFDDSVLVVMAAAPAGLGHLRVMEALNQGLSAKTRVEVMGVKDESIQWIHRLTSRNVALKRMFEFVQDNRLAEKVCSGWFRKYLQTHTSKAEKQLLTLVSTAWPQPETVVVMATHFGLAHQLGAARERLKRKLGVKLVLAVVVTDDSPQEMWAVPGVDVIFVPSNTTREKIVAHLMDIKASVPEIVTVPYPVSVNLGQELTETEYETRLQQAKGKNLEVMIPVSGAAVQLDYFKNLIGNLTADGIKVTVVGKEAGYAAEFVDWCRSQTGVTVVAKEEDMEVVKAYEAEYQMKVIGVEVTKPSEQAFKALLTPKQRGGACLLFTPAVGRQERDNLAFLRRHKLMPSLDDQAKIESWCLTGNQLALSAGLLERAHHWRGLMLPTEGVWAGIAIKRLIEAGILAAMVEFEGFLEGHEEISCEGVKQVWEKVNSLIEG